MNKLKKKRGGGWDGEDFHYTESFYIEASRLVITKVDSDICLWA